MGRLSDAERLARVPLTYELVVRRGRVALYRTTACGVLVDVLEDARRLALAKDGDRCQYTRPAQRMPLAPPGAPAWWIPGQELAAGITSELIITRDAHGQELLEEIQGSTR